MKHEYLEAIAEAKDSGAIPLCGKCHNEATLAIFCQGDKFHGAACNSCWAAHLDMIAVARIFQASGLADIAICSRCNAEDVSDNHIHAERI